MKFAVIMDGGILEFREYTEPPESKHIDGKPVLRPVSEAAKPAFDSATQTLVSADTIHDDHVARAWTAQPLPFDQAGANLKALIQAHLDAAARERDYDNIRSAALRAAYPGPFHDEGLAYATWMDACWAHAMSVMAAVMAGTRTVPTATELVAELPALTLPT